MIELVFPFWRGGPCISFPSQNKCNNAKLISSQLRATLIHSRQHGAFENRRQQPARETSFSMKPSPLSATQAAVSSPLASTAVTPDRSMSSAPGGHAANLKSSAAQSYEPAPRFEVNRSL